ncbi:MAG: NAD-dependent protein deacylase [Candidatus Marinimicrobia bacterium]|nr:NAD-dependent protein deacylase [Candidatus Neomarinimicrobiota bacterium]
MWQSIFGKSQEDEKMDSPNLQLDPFLFEQVDKASHIVALTGAGISAESGIPTFRGEEGLWKIMRPEELANFDAFMENPDRVSEWYEHRREIIDNVEPNPGHKALASMQEEFDYVTIITQNVDGLHQRAGSENVIELHGNIYRNYCVDCKKRYDYNNLRPSEGAPICDECGGYIRPDVVWFGESLPMAAVNEAEQHAASADVMFSIGTSGVVYPAAGLPRMAKSHDAYLVEINPEHTDISLIADETIRMKSGIALPELLNQYHSWKYS